MNKPALLLTAAMAAACSPTEQDQLTVDTDTVISTALNEASAHTDLSDKSNEQLKTARRQYAEQCMLTGNNMATKGIAKLAEELHLEKRPFGGSEGDYGVTGWTCVPFSLRVDHNERGLDYVEEKEIDIGSTTIQTNIPSFKDEKLVDLEAQANPEGIAL